MSSVPEDVPLLSRELLRARAARARGSGPPATLPETLLPEKALQFGSGAFLRGFVEPFLDEANERGTFGGSVVIVQSTGGGRSRALLGQDGLYTVISQGGEAGAESAAGAEERRIVSVVSRALSAMTDWDDVLGCARNPDLELIFSNTTEVGIMLDESDDPALDPPRSFPGKLTRLLIERARAFDYDPARGVVVVPCELIENNGDRLREIVLVLADRWGLGDAFRHWVEHAVPFCNTLVDRIVPGSPEPSERATLEEELGYRDEMLTLCEPYRLFVIQADEEVRARLRFAHGAPDILLVDDERPYRERKVRLLNGAHTVITPVGLLAGCETVYQTTRDDLVGEFLRRLLLGDLAPALDVPDADEFAHQVLRRFVNPAIHHELLGITLHGTMKMRTRVVPSILCTAEINGRAPDSLALGFACFLLFMRGDIQAERRDAGHSVPPDDSADRFRALWSGVDPTDPAAASELVRAAASDASLWGHDLTAVPGFVASVTEHLVRASTDGVPAALRAHLRS